MSTYNNRTLLNHDTNTMQADQGIKKTHNKTNIMDTTLVKFHSECPISFRPLMTLKSFFFLELSIEILKLLSYLQH